MKKYLLTISVCAALLTGSQLNGQIIYSEDFDNIPGPTAGGAGTYVMAPGMLLRNVDNLTPAGAVSYVNEAWERREDFGANVTDSCAFSTSWYNPTGTANDFMWTPLIGPLPANCNLSWDAKAYDAMYPDGYEVRIMTTAPTGGTGVLGNQISSSTVIFSTAAEAAAWTSHTVSLAAYAGQAVYIGFRNNSNDKFILVIDDIVVQTQINFDPQLLSYTAPSEYSKIPLQQQPTIPLASMIRNNGGSTVTGVSLTANVYDIATNGLVFTSSSAVTSLAAGASASFSTSAPFVPAAIGNYRIEYVASGASDDVPANNMLMDSISITDSTFARDRGAMNGTLGIGTGSGGFLGQHFVTTQNAELTSVDIFLGLPVAGLHMGAVIYPMVNGYPDVSTPIYSWPNITVTSATPGWYHFQTSGSPLILLPDTFVVEAVEVDSTLSIGLTTQIFNNNSTWVDWPANPIVPWGNNEDYGSGFTKTYMIRANLRDQCASLAAAATSTSATCGACLDGSATVAVNGGFPAYTYAWSPAGGAGATATGLGAGTYTVTVSDQMGCITTATVTIGNDCSTYGVAATTVDASCGTCADGSATATTTNGSGPFTYLWSNGDTAMTADSLLPGAYTVTITDASGCNSTATVTVTFTTGIYTIGASGSAGIFPNPSEGNFTLSITLAAATDVEIEVVNALGQRVYSESQLNYAGGKLPLFIDAPGIYTVKISTSEGMRAIPLLIKN
jgi:hypothetical protein